MLIYKQRAVCIICSLWQFSVPTDIITYILLMLRGNTIFNDDNSFTIDNKLYVKDKKTKDYKLVLSGVKYTFSFMSTRIIFYLDGRICIANMSCTIIGKNISSVVDSYIKTNGLGSIQDVLGIGCNAIGILTSSKHLLVWMVWDTDTNQLSIIRSNINKIETISQKFVATDFSGCKTEFDMGAGEIIQSEYDSDDSFVPFEFSSDLEKISNYEYNLVHSTDKNILIRGIVCTHVTWMREIYFLTKNGDLFSVTRLNKSEPVKILSRIESIHSVYETKYAVMFDGQVYLWEDKNKPALLKFIT